MKLSLTMRTALERARRAGGMLHRWPGGFWTDAPFTGERAFPDWSAATQTVAALVDRGLFTPVDWTVPRVAGRKLAVVRLTTLHDALTVETPEGRLGGAGLAAYMDATKKGES